MKEKELDLITSCLDLTSLNDLDSKRDIEQLCEHALNPYGLEAGYHVAAVCVYPLFIREAKNKLEHSSVRVATVVGGFPHGQCTLNQKKLETKEAILEGADEVDLVFSRGLFLDGLEEEVLEEVCEIKKICSDESPTVTLKVILETGQLEQANAIKKAAKIALEGGADFIKTSTGKAHRGASIKDCEIFCEAIKDFHETTGHKKGLKLSGGIKTVEDARAYVSTVRSLLGESWISSEFLRFGASSLLNALKQERSI